MIRKIFIASLLFFWAATIYILASGLVEKQSSAAQASSALQQQIIERSKNSPPAALAEDKFSFETLKLHDRADDCWMAIGNKVYDLTKYLNIHPGGPGTLIPYCGKDATAAFQTKDANPAKPHSQFAESLLDQYYVGTIGQEAAQNSSNQGGKSGSSPISPASQTASLVQPVKTTAPKKLPVSTPFPSSAPLPVTSPVPTPQSTPAPANPSFTYAEISLHDSSVSCWMIISGKVYDVTSYLPYHPGGMGAILPYCGGDGTAEFTGLPHSTSADSILASYYIGDLNTDIPAPSPDPGPLPFVSPTPSPPPTPTPALKPKRPVHNGY